MSYGEDAFQNIDATSKIAVDHENNHVYSSAGSKLCRYKADGVKVKSVCTEQLFRCLSNRSRFTCLSHWL